MGVDAVSLDYPNGPAKGYENKVMSLEVQTGITFSLMQYMYIGTIYIYVCVCFIAVAVLKTFQGLRTLPIACVQLGKLRHFC